jgi:hypothetical protein
MIGDQMGLPDRLLLKEKTRVVRELSVTGSAGGGIVYKENLHQLHGRVPETRLAYVVPGPCIQSYTHLYS